MQKTLLYCHTQSIPFHIVGKGSNSLFDDAGFDGLIIHNKIHFCEIEDGLVSVGAGYSFSLLGSQTARKGLTGLEFASGIPASVGGAIFMNAGASGREVKDSLLRVEFVTEKADIEVFETKAILFRYRWSLFQERKGAIVSAQFQLEKGADSRKNQLKIIEHRNKTQPLKEMSCGCVFRNPEGQSAGALIEQCGLKGRSVRGAHVSNVHANFIVNKGGATASDVLQLAEEIKKCVKERTGIELELELRMIK